MNKHLESKRDMHTELNEQKINILVQPNDKIDPTDRNFDPTYPKSVQAVRKTFFRTSGSSRALSLGRQNATETGSLDVRMLDRPVLRT